MNALTSSRRRWLIRGLILVGVLGLVAGSAYYYLRVRPRQRAWARWAEIGRPMPEFEASLHVEENQSLRDLLEDLRPLAIMGPYRAAYVSAGPQSSPTNSPFFQEIQQINGVNRGCGDAVSLAGVATPYLDSQSEVLSRIYRRILEREAPTWRMDFKAGLERAYPNYLQMRMLAQLFAADARRRLALGDVAGASEAIKAQLRVTESFGRSPYIISVMIRCALESMSADVVARLPAETEQWDNHAAETEAVRENFRRALQTSALEVLTWPRAVGRSPKPSLLTNPSAWWAWLQTPADLDPKTNGAEIAQAQADVVVITTQAKHLNTPDLDTAAIEAAVGGKKEYYGENYHRAWNRLQVTLLIQEQANLIRLVRARLYRQQEIKPDEFPSAVVPGAHWVVIANPAALTATFQLTPVPAWATDRTIISGRYYPVSIDGTEIWQFAPPPADSTKP